MIVRVTGDDRIAVLEIMAAKLRTTPHAMVGECPYELLAAMCGKGLMGAVLYNNYRDGSIEMHQAGVPGWLTRSHLREFFAYPFQQLKCRRVTGLVHRKNKHARDINERLGFKQEGVIRKAFPNGDGILYGMLQNECRWI